MKTIGAWIILIIGLLFFTIIGARIIGFYTSGADRTNLLQANLNNDLDYNPKITWLKNSIYNKYESTSLTLDETIIEAFYWLNKSMENKQSLKLRDYFDVSQYATIDSLLDHQEVDIERAYLSHDLELKHLSLDKSVAVVKCHKAEVIERFTDQKLSSAVNFYNIEYTLIMVVIDGNWKIKNWITERSWTDDDSEIERDISEKLALIPDVRGINYYPKDAPWHLFWDSLEIQTLKKDFEIIQHLGFNTVRVFLSFDDFNVGEAFDRNIPKFQLVLDVAKEHRLQVIPTLFDFPIGYRLEDYVKYDNQLQAIISSTESHPGILAWNLKNEPDLDFELHGKQSTLDWLDYILRKAKTYDKRHPITISWSDKSYLKYLSDEVDYLSFHLYKDFDDWETAVKDISHETGKYAMLEEFGTSTRSGLSNLLGRSESRQLSELKEIVRVCDKEGLPFMVWTLYDFSTLPSGVFGWKPWVKSKQSHFGLIREDGSQKPAAEVFKVK